MQTAQTIPTGHRPWLVAILIAYAVLAGLYSVVTPPFEASDELWHYPMVRYVADHGFGLPVQDPANPGPWRQEGSQPPLYYLLGALATSWIDTSDMDEVRRINPHADIGAIVPDRNLNMVLHDTEREAFPWSGTVLAVHIVRFLSIGMGLGTVLLTYLLARELFPDLPILALAAAAFTGFNPMFVFISAAINNDNLSNLLAALILLLIVRLLKAADTPPTRRFTIALGLAAGTGMLAKYQIGFLLPVIALALLFVSIRQRDWRPVIVGGAIAGGLTILIAGWWYWRNYDLYGDATGINVFLDIVGRRVPPADLHQLWTERETFMMSFWGLFGGVNLPLPDATYTLFNLLAAFSALGLAYGLLTRLTRRPVLPASREERLLWLARGVAIAWPVVVFLSLLTWTRVTLASQGRLWFTALAPLSVWMAVGLANWARRSPAALRVNLGMAAAVFIGIAAMTPFATLRPAYRVDPDAAWVADTLETGTPRAACFAEPGAERDVLCLAYRAVSGALLPGDDLRLAPTMTVTGSMTRNWSVFVHLINADGLTEAQRDVYPGGGLIATAEIEPGDTWNNLIAVRLPPGIYTPQTLDVFLGLYDYMTGDRMIPSGDGAALAYGAVNLGQIELETPPGGIPNPVGANFDDKLRLLGYEIDDRSLRPGDEVAVTLYWERLGRLTANYAVSVQIIQPDTFSKAAQDDRPPDPPVTEWLPGGTIADTRALTVAGDAAPGRYRLMVRVYDADRPDNLLPVLAGPGGQAADFVWLSWIQVE
jgi:4-amino-4-deoxy-L-arabinose transferase-like glycosyltransferase